MHFTIQGNISSIRVLHDGNTNHHGSVHKLNYLIHMFSNVFKGNNPFTTTNPRLSMDFFCFSYDFLYVVILLKHFKMDLGVTTFWTLELCFSKAFVQQNVVIVQICNLTNICFLNVRMFNFIIFLHGWNCISSFIKD